MFLDINAQYDCSSPLTTSIHEFHNLIGGECGTQQQSRQSLEFQVSVDSLDSLWYSS